MTAALDHLSDAPELNEIARIIDQAREGILPPTEAIKAIDQVIKRPDQIYQKPLG